MAERARWFLVGLAVALVALATRSTGQPSELKVGFIVDQTGPLAAIAGSYIRGVDVVVEMWNGDAKNRKVVVRPCDSQSTGEGALTCYRQLESGVDVIMGPHLFIGLASVRGAAAQKPPAWVTTVPFANPPAGSWLFQSLPTIDDAIGAGFAYYRAKGVKRVATLTSNDQPGNIAKQAAQKLAGSYGLELVRVEVFDPQAQNLAPQAENIAASKPDGVTAWTAGPQLVTALRALKGAGISAPVMLNYASMSVPLLKQLGRETPAELLFYGTAAFDPQGIADAAYRERVTAYNERYRRKFGTMPDMPAYAAADIALVVLQAGQGAASPREIRDALTSGKPFSVVLFDTLRFTATDHVGKRGAEAFSILKWQPDSTNWVLAK